METGRKGKAIIGISMAAIMIVSALVAAMPIAVARSDGTNFNIIEGAGTQKVLIGQNLEFRGYAVPVTISRLVSGDVENVYQADANNRVYNVNWPTSGAYFVNYVNGTAYAAQLSVETPDMPLDLKVGTKKVSSLAVGTALIIDTGGMNLYPDDVIDLVVIGPDGQIKHDDVNNQQFTGISVDQLVNNYGSAANTLETAGWTIGAYTFKVKTKSENACGLEAESAVKDLKIIKGTITIEAETTSTVELETLKLTVTGVSGDPISVNATPLSKNVIFKEGIDDTPTGANFHGSWFTDTIDADGIRKYAVEFNDTGTYTIKVTVTGTGDRAGDSDTVDITVLEKEVTFDLPDEVVIGDKITIKGTATSGTYVSVYIDDTLYQKLVNIVIEDNEFSQEVKTTDVGMDVPGSVRLKAWIDCDKAAGEERPTRSPDGEDAILLSKPTLTAELSVPSVALEDDFKVEGTAKGQTEVTILCVPPKGGGGKSLLDKGDKGLSPRKASVSTTDDTYSKKMTVQEDATAGYYDIYVLCAGMDGEWGMTGQESLEAALNQKFHIPSLTTGIINTKTQAEIEDILEALVTTAGADDLMQKLRLKVETAYVKLDPVADVTAGEPLVVTGTSNRQQGYVIVLTCKGPVELAPKTVKVENDTFGATFDTTGALTGEYIVKADDGDGHVDEAEVFITGAGVAEIVEEVEEVVEEITATPAPTPKPTPAPTAAPTPEATPKPPGFEAIFAIAGLLAVAYLVLRRKK
jgi:PGF-CTERM protein